MILSDIMEIFKKSPSTMESTISNYFNPHLKPNYTVDYAVHSQANLISASRAQFSYLASTHPPYSQANQLNTSNPQFQASTIKMSPIQRNQTNLPQLGQSTRSHLKQPTSTSVNGHSNGHTNGHQPINGHSTPNTVQYANAAVQSISTSSNRTHPSSGGKREIPRLPNMMLTKLSNSSQPSSLSSSTISSVSSSYSNQNSQRNSLQSPAFDKSAINGLKSNSSKLQRPLSDTYSTVAAQPPSHSSRSSPIMSKPSGQLRQSNLGSTSNLSSLRPSNSFRSSIRSNQEHQPETAGRQATKPFGLQSKYNSLSKSNLANTSTSNLNRSNLNLNTLPSHAKQPTANNSLKSLSTSTTHLTTDASLTGKRSLIKPKSATPATSGLPAPKSRPTSAYLSDGLNGTLKTKSKLPNSSCNSRKSSNLNLSEHQSSTANLAKPSGTPLKPATLPSPKDPSFNVKGLNKKPQTSISIKCTMQSLSQSSSSSLVYKPYSSLTNRSKPKASDTTKCNLESVQQADQRTESMNTKDKISKSDKPLLGGKPNLIRRPNSQNGRSPVLEKCNNVARVSPIRRQYTMSNHTKRQLNGSLNSSDQEEDELDDDLFDTSTLNQQTSDDTNSFNSEDAKYYAVLSSSDDDKLVHGSRARSRERKERRLRRASGQRSSSSKRTSPAAASTASLPVCKSKTSTLHESGEQLDHHSKKQDLNKDNLNSSTRKSTPHHQATTATPTSNQQSLKHRSSSSNLNKSNSSSVNTIDHKSTSLNIMFPTLNRLHNSISIQQLNTDASHAAAVSTASPQSANGSTALKTAEEHDYQSDLDAETTLFKLKSLDFNCNSTANYATPSTSMAVKERNSTTRLNSLSEKDGNNNSLNYSGNLANNGHQLNDNSQSTNEYTSFTTPALTSMLSNYMSRSIGSLTGSLNGLNNSNAVGLNHQINNSNNWSTHKACSTPPLLANFRSKSPNVYPNCFLNSTAPSSSFQPQFTSFLSSPTPLQSSSTTNTVINNVQNTTVLNSVPASFTSRLGKCGETRGSSLSLLSACSSNYSNNLSITLNPSAQVNSPQCATPNDQRLYLDKSTLNEIKYLKNELNRANEKINLLKSQLVTSGQMVNSFEQSLQSKTARMKHYVLQIEEKDREIDYLKSVIENLKKTYGITSLDLNYRSNSNSPVPDHAGGSSNLHNSRAQANNNSDGESMILRNKSKQDSLKKSKKRSSSKKSRANSVNANSTDDEDTASLASVHSKDGTLNGSTSWFKSSITKAFKKKRDRSKHGSHQELDKVTLVDHPNDAKHPHHPSQLHQSYIQQDKFKDNELVDLKAQLIEKEKSLTDERLKALSLHQSYLQREDEMMKLKECLNCLQQELFSLKKRTIGV